MNAESIQERMLPYPDEIPIPPAAIVSDSPITIYSVYSVGSHGEKEQRKEGENGKDKINRGHFKGGFRIDCVSHVNG